jgi:hypothetical protein
VVEVGDGAGAVAFSAAGGKVVGAGVAGSTHSLEQALNSAPLSGAFCLGRRLRNAMRRALRHVAVARRSAEHLQHGHVGQREHLVLCAEGSH